MLKGYYFITDSTLSKAGDLSDVNCAVAAGVQIIQYRAKSASTRHMHEEALMIKKACCGSKSKLIINDRLDIALSAEADGIHIGQDDIPYSCARKFLGADKIIGVTVHSVEEALKAEDYGADYLGVSPVFSTGTKLDAGAPCGTELVSEIRKKCSLPIVAIGGINLENASKVIGAGADMICAISAVVAAENVIEEIEKFQGLFRI